MSVGRIGSSGADSAWAAAAAAGAVATADGAAQDVSLDDLAALMVEADREQRSGARATRRALAEAARAERQAAIRAQREAASDAFDSAIVQAVVGGVAALAEGVAAIGAASAGTAAVEGAAATVEGVATATEGGALAAVPWHRWVEIGAKALPHAAPIFDAPARSAEDHRIHSQEHADAAQWLDDQARLAGDDAEAARAAERSHVEAVGRAMDLIEQGRSVAIGREAG